MVSAYNAQMYIDCPYIYAAAFFRTMKQAGIQAEAGAKLVPLVW